MGTPKALLDIGGETFLDRMIGLLHGVCETVVVVLGHDRERIQAGTQRLAQTTVCVNPQPDRGMFSSLQCGLLAFETQDVDAVLFTPVDLPGLQPETIHRIAAERGRQAVVPVFQGHRGHPVLIGRQLIEEMLKLPEGGRATDVMRAHLAQTCMVVVDDPGITADVDTPEEYDLVRGGA